jgi:hypothetical protein
VDDPPSSDFGAAGKVGDEVEDKVGEASTLLDGDAGDLDP